MRLNKMQETRYVASWFSILHAPPTHMIHSQGQRRYTVDHNRTLKIHKALTLECTLKSAQNVRKIRPKWIQHIPSNLLRMCETYVQHGSKKHPKIALGQPWGDLGTLTGQRGSSSAPHWVPSWPKLTHLRALGHHKSNQKHKKHVPKPP